MSILAILSVKCVLISLVGSGECGVGQEIADYANKKLTTKQRDRFNDLIAEEQDDRGCWRPVKIYPTLGRYNNGNGQMYKIGKKKKKNTFPAYLSVAIVSYERPTASDIKLMKKRAEEFAQTCRDGKIKEISGSVYSSPKFNITGFRLVTKQIVLNEETI
jgi:hypothetical protein